MEAYAVLESGGKQTLVKVGQKIEIEKIAVEAGQDAELTTVLAVSDGTTPMSRARRSFLRSTASSRARRSSTSRRSAAKATVVSSVTASS